MVGQQYAGLTVSAILRGKKASVRQAPLPPGSSSWRDIEQMTWEQIEAGARENLPGFKTVRKLLTDTRFNR